MRVRHYSSGVRLNDVVIVSGVRTPIGSFGGAFSSLSAPQLAAVAIQVCHIVWHRLFLFLWCWIDSAFLYVLANGCIRYPTNYNECTSILTSIKSLSFCFMNIIANLTNCPDQYRLHFTNEQLFFLLYWQCKWWQLFKFSVVDPDLTVIH